jgi:hypothetical protein
MNFLNTFKTRNSFLQVIIFSIMIGVISSVNLYVTLGFMGFIIYIIFFIKFNQYENFKKIIPIFIIITIFQDLLSVNLSLINEGISTIINNIDEIFILLSFPIVIFNHYRTRKINEGEFVRSIKIDFINFSFLLIFLIGIISSIINNVPGNIIFQGSFLMLKGLLVFFIFRNIPFRKYDLKLYTKFIKIIAILILFFALIDLFSYNILRELLNTNAKVDVRSGIISVQSLFIHPGVYGWFMTFIGLYFLAHYSVFKRKKYIFFSLVYFAGAFLSFRFKAMISIIIGILYSYLQNGLRKVLYGILPAMLIIVLIFMFLGNEIINLTSLTFERYVNVDYLESARKALYVVGITIGVNEFPFGVGFGRYGGWIARVHYSPVYYEYGLNRVYGLKPSDPKWATDTYWPHIIGEIGIIGAILLLCIFLYSIFYIMRGYKLIDDKKIKTFLLFSVLIIIQSIIESLGEQIYNSAPQYLFIFAIMGMSFSIIERFKRKEN